MGPLTAVGAAVPLNGPPVLLRLGALVHRPLVSWGIANHVTAAALTDALILMAIVMVLMRMVGLRVRASRLTVPALPAQNA